MQDEVDGEVQAAAPPRWQKAVQVVAVVAVIAVLKWIAPVAIPVVFALMIIALLAPLKQWLSQRMPQGVAVGLCLLVFVAGAAGFGWTLAETADAVEDGFDAHRDNVDAWYQKARKALHIADNGPDQGEDTVRWFRQGLKLAAGGAFSFLGGFVLVLAFLGLGLLEARVLRERLEQTSRAKPALQALARIARNIRQYLFARTVVGLATGLLVGLVTWALGLELAFVWGLSTFLLNYIPTLGSIVAVLPPALFALLQFNDLPRAAVTFGAVTALQVVMGSYVDPLVEGRFVSLSAFVVLLSVVFWGWLWGIPGSFVGVPMTLALVIWADEFNVSRWLYTLTAGPQR